MVMGQACGLWYRGGEHFFEVSFRGGEHFFQLSLGGGEAFFHGYKRGAKRFLVNINSFHASRNVANYVTRSKEIKAEYE